MHIIDLHQRSILIFAICTNNSWRQHYKITDTASQYASTHGSTDLMGICVSYASELLEPSFMPVDVCLGNTGVYALHSLHTKIADLQLVKALHFRYHVIVTRK